MNGPFPLIIRGLRDLAGMELSGIEVRPELPEASPITMRREDGACELIGLRFSTADEAAAFADGVAGVVTQCDRDGQRVFLNKPAPINPDFTGVN